MKPNKILVIIFTLIIILGSSIPGKNVPDLYLFRLDKILHILEYYILGYLLINALNGKTNFPGLLTFVLGLIFGVIDEIYQSTVFGRFPSSFDVFANAIGLTLSIVLYQKFLKK